MRRLLVWLLIVVVVLALAIWATLRHVGAVQIERVAEVLGPVVFMHELGTRIDMDGVAHAEQVELIANDQRYFRQLYMETLSLRAGGLHDSLRRSLRETALLPAEFELRIAGVRAPPRPLEAGPHWWYSFNTLLPLETVGCRYVEEPVEGSYSGRGYPPMRHDWRLIQRQDEQGQQIELLLDNGGLGYTQIQAQFSGLDWAQLLDGRTDLSKLMLRELRLSWPESAAVMRERNGLCAERLNTDEAGYLQAHQTALEEMFASLGVVADPPLLDLLMDYARGEGSLILEAKLAKPVSVAELIELPLDQRMARLRMAASLDDASPVAMRLHQRPEGRLQFDGRLALPTEDSGKGGLRLRSSGDSAASSAAAAATTAEAEQKSPWPAPISVAEAAQHIGAEVSVATVNGRNYRGILKELDAKTLTVEVRMGGGAATFPIPRNQIKRIERLR